MNGHERRSLSRVDDDGAPCFGRVLSGDHVGVHAKFRRVPLSGSRVVRELGSRVKSACRDGNGNGRQEGEPEG